MATFTLHVWLPAIAIMFSAGLTESATITESPMDSADTSGESLNLTCQVNGVTGQEGDRFSWVEFITDASYTTIFSDPPNDNPMDTNRYQIHGRFDLNIKSLSWRDGGVYECRLWDSDTAHRAHVFVFEPHSMSFTQMSEGDTQTLICESRFGASVIELLDDEQKPVMTMEINGKQLTVATELIEMTASEPFKLTGTAEYTAVAVDGDQDYVCAVSVKRPNGYVARKSIKTNILYEVEVPQLAPTNVRYYVNEQINCTARGNPNPTYRWESVQSPLGSGITYDGPILLIREDMMAENQDPQDQNNVWRCIASNTIKGDIKSQFNEITFGVDPAPPGSEETGPGPKVAGWKIGVGVGVPLGVIAIGAAVAAGYVVTKRRKQAAEAAKFAEKQPPPEIGADNKGAAFPSDGPLVNGSTPTKTRTPISSLPDPTMDPAKRSRDSPGYADLGIKQISGSYPGVNVSINSSIDSFDEMHQDSPPSGHVRPADLEPNSHVNRSYQSETPPEGRARPNYSNIPPNHPDTFV